jgi:hypothetical protein
MNQLKPGREKILQHIEYLIDQSWLTDSQKFWPRFLFHFTNITNAKDILADGFLFSRAQLQKSGKLITDIASPEIIKSTADKWKSFVRLYFRPLTPMQYSIEGFRSKVNIKYDAHCPVPVIFVFDAKEILTLQPTRFSNGNLRAEGVQVSDSADFYLSLPFKMIYHDASLQHLSDGEKRSVIFHRHAEVIIPGSLALSNLSHPEHYRVSFYLDNQLAYLNIFRGESEIF